MYENGNLIHENGTISLHDVEKAAQDVPFTLSSIDLCDTEADTWTTMCGGCPDHIAEFLVDHAKDIEGFQE